MLQQNEQAPIFAAKATDGQTYQLDDQLTLVIFFKTTCPTCRYGWPFYERLYRAYRANGLHVWGISQHDAERTSKWKKELGATFPHLVDANLAISREYEPQFVPTGFLVGPGREIIDSFVSWDMAKLSALSSRIADELSISPQAIFGDREAVVPFKPG